MYRTVTFKSTFPNQWQFDHAGNAVAPGARELAEAIVASLRSRVESTTAIEQHSYFGWGFEVTFENRRFCNVVNPAGDEACLTVQFPWQWVWELLLRRPKKTFDRYCDVLADSLAAIPQVSAINWGT